MLSQIRPAIVLLLALTLITGLIYPLAMTGIAQVVLQRQAQGSLVEKDGRVVGSALIGQAFAEDKYFRGRPSATTAPDPLDGSKSVSAPYNASSSAGSNAGPTSKLMVARVSQDMQKIAGEGTGKTPIDLVTTSASGLDPHISPDGAMFQVPRVAKARNMSEEDVRQLVRQLTEGRLAGLLGEPRVNVLALNMALDGSPR